MKLTMLGTGNALVTECYNTCFVLEQNGKYLLVDAGGGNQVLYQLKAAGYNWMDMKDIFVTHKHLDHIMGVFWMKKLQEAGYNAKGYVSEGTAHEFLTWRRCLYEMAPMLFKK